ncbi:MAG: hypothetical protein LBB63_02665 [Holosporaceae bacterium]|jgi:hypothetical protein|nr:hypothetical protein [Holosporaceae bacterium]
MAVFPTDLLSVGNWASDFVTVGNYVEAPKEEYLPCVSVLRWMKCKEGASAQTIRDVLSDIYNTNCGKSLIDAMYKDIFAKCESTIGYVKPVF